MKITRKSLKMMLVFCNFSKKRIKISLSKNFYMKLQYHLGGTKSGTEYN